MDGLRNYSYDDAVDEIARQYGVPKSVYQKMLGQESGDTDSAVSNKGAFSAWQIMPATARGLGYDPQELKDEPLKAAEGGLRILRDNFKQFRQHAQNDLHAWMMSVAGYHGSPQNVLKDLKAGGLGIPNYSDGSITTRDHVGRIFDGFDVSTLNRSPLGNAQTTFQSSPKQFGTEQQNKTFVDPALIPKVSVGELPAEMFQPEILTTQNPVSALPPSTAPQSFPLSNFPKPEQIISQLPPQNIPAPERTLENYGRIGWRDNLTKLNQSDEQQFQEWAKQNNVPITDDYDMRGFWNALRTGDERAKTAINPNDNQIHFPDIWKTPLHKSFSNESIYALENAPRWNDKNQLIDSRGDIVFDEKPNAQTLPEHYQNFLKYSELTDSPEAKNLYSKNVIEPLAKTEAEQNEKYLRDVDNYNRSLQTQRTAPVVQPPPNAQTQPPQNTPLAYEIPKNESNTATIDQRLYDSKNELADDSNARRSVAGVVNVDMSRKPAGVPLSQWLFTTALDQIGTKYNLTPGQKAAAANAYKNELGSYLQNDYADVTDENYQDFLNQYKTQFGDTVNPITLSRNVINAALTGKVNAPLSEAVRKDLQREQNDRNLDFYTSNASTGKAEFENDLTPRDTSALQGQRQTEREKLNNPEYQLRKQAEDNIYNSSLTGGTEAEVLAEMERLKRLEISPETKAMLEGIGTIGKNSLGNYFGGNSDITSGIIGAGGGIADLIAGVNRPFAALGITDGSAYEAWSKIGQGARVIENSMKNDDIGGDVLNLVGRSAVDIPKYAVMSALPGGAVVGFGLDSGLQTAGRGENVGEVIKQTAKGASLGVLFNLSGGIGDKISNVLIKPVAKIGTVGVGTFAVEKAFGATDEEAFKSALMNSLFEASHSLGDLRGKFARVWEKGQAREVKIDEKGDVLLLKGLEKSPVDIELVLDPKDGSYKPNPRNENVTRETFPEDVNAIDAEYSEIANPRSTETVQPKNELVEQNPKNNFAETKPEIVTEQNPVVKTAAENSIAVLHKDVESVPSFDQIKNFSVETENGVLVVNDAKLKDYFKEKNLGYYDRNKAVWMLENGKLNASDIASPITSPIQSEVEQTSKAEQATESKTSSELQSSDVSEQPKKLSSTQVNVEREQAAEISNFARKLIAPEDILTEGLPSYAKDGFGGDPHITVKYGIESNNVKDVENIFSGEKEVSAMLGKTKVFSGKENNKPYDVVVVEVDSPDLHKLNKKVSENTKTTDTFNEYKPHLTLGYVKAGLGEKYVNNSQFEGQKIKFGSVEFSPANGEKQIIKLSGQTSLPFSKAENLPAKLSGKNFTADGQIKRLNDDLVNAIEKDFTPEDLRAAKISPNGKMNEQAFRLISDAHRIKAQAEKPEVFFGSYLNPKNVVAVRSALTELLKINDPEFTGENRKQAERILNEYDNAVDATHGDMMQIASSKNIPESLPEVWEEEAFHRVDYRIGSQHQISAKIFQSDSVGREAMANLRQGAYRDVSDTMLAVEVGAKIHRTDAEKELKISAEKVKYLRQKQIKAWMDSGRTKEEIIQALSEAKELAQNYGNTETERPSDRGNTGNSKTTDTGRTGQSNGFSRRNGERTREGKSLERLNPLERAFVEKASKGNKDLAEKVAGEIAYAKKSFSLQKMTVGDYAIDLVNMPKALKATADLSAAGRQGLIVSLPHPVIATKAFIKQLAAGINFGNYHERFLKELEKHPFAKMAKETGLYISNFGDGSLNQREEAFLSRVLGDEDFFKNRAAEKSRKLITAPIRASERAYSTYLDDIRINVFSELTRQVYEYNKRNGIDDNAFIKNQIEGVAKYVNFATGRGDLGRFEDAGEFLNVGIFSARNWISRFQILNPNFYRTLPEGAKSVVIKDFAKYLGAMALAYTLWKLGGGDIEIDIDNPDFMKLKFGQHRYEISGGMVQQIRWLAQTVRSVATGDFSSAAKNSLNYVRGKLSPVPAAIVSAATQTKISGEPTTAKSEAAALVLPISIEQLAEGLKTEGSLGAVLSLPDIFGISHSRYANSLEIGMQLAEVERQLAKAQKGSDEEKELNRLAGLWRKYYKRAKKQDGELPRDLSLSPEEQEDREKFDEDRENVTFVNVDDEDESDEQNEKPAKKYELGEKIEFYKKNKDTLFSFAKDQLESLIVQQAENLRMRGKLSKLDEVRVKQIIPDYEPLQPNDGVNYRPDKLKKLPNSTEDFPRLPKMPKLPPIPVSR